ncbi:hypothetical protein [Shouchella clausii]|uniref:hypothetical protein n=1 Tax=Shouchella clausii TaxID=79880 RepID=UPI003182C634
MKKGIWIPIVVLIALGGGVAMAFALNGSDDIALTDDFTSSFLDPEVETDEGFHYFQSEKNNFSMWFPAGYYIEDDPVGYESKDHFEFLNIHEDQSHSNEKEYWGFIQLKYRGNMIEHDAEIQLQILLKKNSWLLIMSYIARKKKHVPSTMNKKAAFSIHLFKAFASKSR